MISDRRQTVKNLINVSTGRELVNSPEYWDHRFDSGDWDNVGGREQTRMFAEKQVRLLALGRSFGGTLLDFGCGLGDAFPVYRRELPQATLMGMDVSAAAIEKCRSEYGSIARFEKGDHVAVPSVDVIVTSNVLEHLSDPLAVARALRKRCRALYVIVPFREWPRIEEHIHTFDRDSFNAIGVCRTTVFSSRGWSQYGWNPVWVNIYLKNLIRPLIGRKRVRRRRQILYRFEAASHS